MVQSPTVVLSTDLQQVLVGLASLVSCASFDLPLLVPHRSFFSVLERLWFVTVAFHGYLTEDMFYAFCQNKFVFIYRIFKKQKSKQRVLLSTP